MDFFLLYIATHKILSYGDDTERTTTRIDSNGRESETEIASERE
jgi:hypothetical protein